VISLVFDPLYPMVEQGQFLEGLFYRLNVVSLEAESR
jgi:DNA-binding NtrC family response regulator